MRIPGRKNNAITGSQFVQKIMRLNGNEREALSYRELVSGNIPDFIRNLIPITASNSDKSIEITYYVMPDYLCIGSDEDYFRVPMMAPTAQAVANYIGASLPTKAMVDQIYDVASKQKTSVPFKNKPVPGMASTKTFEEHNRETNERIGQSAKPGQLVAGHMKDVLLGNAMKDGKKLMIYGGWMNGKPVQPAVAPHDSLHIDYSSGIRFIDQNIQVKKDDDIKNINIKQALQDKDLADILNKGDGVLKRTSYDTEGKELYKPEDNKAKDRISVTDKEQRSSPTNMKSRLSEYAKIIEENPDEFIKEIEQSAGI